MRVDIHAMEMTEERHPSALALLRDYVLKEKEYAECRNQLSNWLTVPIDRGESAQ